MPTLTRRQFIGTSAAASALCVLPNVSLATPTASATLVHPTTNILRQGARFGNLYNFTRDEILSILGPKDLANIPQHSHEYLMERYKEKRPYTSWPDEVDSWIGASIEAAKDRAEAGENEIYQRGEILQVIRRRLNDHFKFSKEPIREWLNASNPHLNGISFRELMVRDIVLAAEQLDLALLGPKDS